jgi:hypothetical protein
MKKIYAINTENHQNERWRLHAYGDDLISQAEAVVIGTATSEPEFKAIPDLDYLQVGPSVVLMCRCHFLHRLCVCAS